MAAVTKCSDFGTPPKYSLSLFPLFLHLFPMSDGTGCHNLSSLNIEFWANLFTHLFHFHKRVFSSSLSAVSVVLSAYLKLLIFLSEILFPACASSSPVFLIMLNKQGDNIQPWCTPFSIWNQSAVPCPVLTVASWPAYRFLRRQVRWSVIPIFWRIFRSLLWSTQSKALA